MTDRAMSEALRLADFCRTGALIDDEWDQVADILERLHAENEALRADAERWRWIADGNNFDESFALLTDPKLTTYELTRAVDAARKESA